MNGLPVLMPGLVLAVGAPQAHRPTTCPDELRQRLQAAREAAQDSAERTARWLNLPDRK